MKQKQFPESFKELGVYSLKVGDEGKRRLEILNSIYNPESLRLMEKHGLKEGMTVLDIGCGIGLLTCEIAKIVGDEGSVVALDNSKEQLTLVKQEVKKRELRNVETVCLSAHEINKLEMQFDVIYCRFVLGHLQDSEVILEKLTAILNPGGMLVLEELAGTDCFACYPPSSSYAEFVEAAKKQSHLQKSDFEIGYKLPHIMQKLGYTIEIASMYQPLLTTSYQKEILTLGAVEAGPAFIKAGFYTQTEVEALILGLKKLESDEEFFAAYQRIGQVVARKPA